MSPVRSLALTCACVSIAIAAGTASADQPAEPFPVQRIQLVLQADAKTPEDLKSRLEQLEALTSAKALPDTELVSALALDSWKDLDLVPDR